MIPCDTRLHCNNLNHMGERKVENTWLIMYATKHTFLAERVFLPPLMICPRYPPAGWCSYDPMASMASWHPGMFQKYRERKGGGREREGFGIEEFWLCVVDMWWWKACTLYSCNLCSSLPPSLLFPFFLSTFISIDITPRNCYCLVMRLLWGHFGRNQDNSFSHYSWWVARYCHKLSSSSLFIHLVTFLTRVTLPPSLLHPPK